VVRGVGFEPTVLRISDANPDISRVP